MEEAKPDQISTKITDLKADISKFREELNGLDAEKEKWYQNKETISKEILELIRKVKSSKGKRNNLTDRVKADKKKRSELNTQIKEKIADIKKLHSERDEIAKKKKITADPAVLKREIAQLDTKIETSVMPFEQEQKLMKIIRDKKKELNESKDLVEVTEKISTLSKNIDLLKKSAEEVHQSIQSTAGNSQIEHEQMFETSKKIDELRVKEEEAYKTFMDFKKKFSDVNVKLKHKLAELNSIHSDMDTERLAARKEKKKADKKKLEVKKVEIDDKIKKRQKLTTEDLLIFQKTVEEKKE